MPADGRGCGLIHPQAVGDRLQLAGGALRAGGAGRGWPAAAPPRSGIRDLRVAVFTFSRARGGWSRRHDAAGLHSTRQSGRRRRRSGGSGSRTGYRSSPCDQLGALSSIRTSCRQQSKSLIASYTPVTALTAALGADAQRALSGSIQCASLLPLWRPPGALRAEGASLAQPRRWREPAAPALPGRAASAPDEPHIGGSSAASRALAGAVLPRLHGPFGTAGHLQ